MSTNKNYIMQDLRHLVLIAWRSGIRLESVSINSVRYWVLTELSNSYKDLIFVGYMSVVDIGDKEFKYCKSCKVEV